MNLYTWIWPWTTSIPVYRPKHTFDLRNSKFAILPFMNNSTPPHSNQPKLSPVSESSTHPLGMLFPTHLQARELCPQTYSLSLPIEWSQVTHIPASINLQTQKVSFYSIFARQLCDDTCLPGWFSRFAIQGCPTLKCNTSNITH